jgi:hypothetical protein
MKTAQVDIPILSAREVASTESQGCFAVFTTPLVPPSPPEWMVRINSRSGGRRTPKRCVDQF